MRKRTNRTSLYFWISSKRCTVQTRILYLFQIEVCYQLFFRNRSRDILSNKFVHELDIVRNDVSRTHVKLDTSHSFRKFSGCICHLTGQLADKPNCVLPTRRHLYWISMVSASGPGYHLHNVSQCRAGKRTVIITFIEDLKSSVTLFVVWNSYVELWSYSDGWEN